MGRVRELWPQAAPVWEKAQALLYNSDAANRHKRRKVSDRSEEVLHKGFLRKYLHYAKSRIEPTLSDDARELISSEYAQLRAKAQENTRTFPVTARQLETLIRLSTAHARARLSLVVEEQDAIAAQELLQFALYHETSDMAASNAKQASRENGTSPCGSVCARAQFIVRTDERCFCRLLGVVRAPPCADQRLGNARDEGDDHVDSDAEMFDDSELPSKSAAAAADLASPAISSTLVAGNARYDTFSHQLERAFEAQPDLIESGLLVSDFLPSLRGQYSNAEVDHILRAMEQDNKVMYQDDVIYWI